MKHDIKHDEFELLSVEMNDDDRVKDIENALFKLVRGENDITEIDMADIFVNIQTIVVYYYITMYEAKFGEINDKDKFIESYSTVIVALLYRMILKLIEETE